METSRGDFASPLWATSLKVENPWAGSPVFVRERTSSSMDDAREAALNGCREGTVVVAGFQERGRGRAPGRSWHSPPWESLMATVVLDASALGFPVALLPLRAAMGVCLAIEEHGVRPLVKWPNDLLVGGRKIAGILCETCGGSVLVGFGVNCTQKRFPEDLAAVACSILQASGTEVNPLSLLPRVLARMKEALGDERWREKLLGRLASRDDLIRVEGAGDSETTRA
ncbi:MAG TPA: biotin--[acetyl-CoA-carboxylase] ligase [Spirochaetia bacterium]|nr:biotin--[acetyl-CoA-carboxylase] ligase [Spirochaetia bacterium]